MEFMKTAYYAISINEKKIVYNDFFYGNNNFERNPASNFERLYWGFLLTERLFVS